LDAVLFCAVLLISVIALIVYYVLSMSDRDVRRRWIGELVGSDVYMDTWARVLVTGMVMDIR